MSSIGLAQGPKAKPGTVVPVIPASQVPREKALEYLTLTRRTDVMEKAYRARFVDVKNGAPVSEEMKKRHLAEINNLLIQMVQKSFSPSAMDSVLVFLKTPGGERWAEDAAEFNAEFRDETAEIFTKFTEEIKEAHDAAADATTTNPAIPAAVKPTPPTVLPAAKPLLPAPPPQRR